ncbi:MAG: DUF6377 domain-containing protein [Chitinophagaceae bacterium]
MKLLIICLLLLFRLGTHASPFSDSLINELNSLIKNSPDYDKQKLAEITQLKALLYASQKEPDSIYAIHLKLYEAYKYFNYDSAFEYAKKLKNFSQYNKDGSLLVDAQVKFVFVMLSGGLFKEAIDSLSVISIKGIAANIAADYYSLKSRCYYDLADFDNDQFYSPTYNRLALAAIDSALVLYPKQSFDFSYLSGLKEFKQNKLEAALGRLRSLISSQKLSYHQTALATSMIGSIYNLQGNKDQARDYYIMASIADIKSSTKETLALLNLASARFKGGDIKIAALYVEKANSDATFYNARLRKVQIGAILPIIEGEMISTIQAQKRKLVIYLILLLVLVLVLAGLGFIIRNQVVKLKAIKQSLLEANQKQQQINAELLVANELKEQYNRQLKETNDQLVESNQVKERYNNQLQEINTRLSEANKIKEEYIGYYFNVDTSFIGRIGKLVKSVEKRLVERKWDEIRLILKSVDLKREKEELLKDFDKVFVRLFPNFVEQFNSLFNDEDKIILKEDQLLNTDLRIFALIRLGITESEKIAEILDYSINTIYAKKTKIRGKANIGKEELERKIMQITTLDLK